MVSQVLRPGLDVLRLLHRCHLLQKAIASSAGLSVDEFHSLCQLYVHAPCCVKTLCERMRIFPSRASRLINALEQKGFLTRSLGVDDRRKELLSLTPGGISEAEKLLRSCALSAHDLSDSLTEGEWSALRPSATTVDSTVSDGPDQRAGHPAGSTLDFDHDI